MFGLEKFDPADPQYATQVVDAILAEGRACGASDLHLQPGSQGLELKYRLNGVLAPAAVFSAKLGPNIIARLKVKAELLTYHTDRPQEGRIRMPESDVEMRVSTFPTLHGERAVVRFFGGSGLYQRLDDLGLPADVLTALRNLLVETSGAIVISGPAGSGKTTTAYACLREIAGTSGPHTPNKETAHGVCLLHSARSLVSIEDPIEVAVDGVAQSQVNPQAGLDLSSGLRFLMRQDPEVILVGEIRDRATADAAMQASLTGHLLLTTFHAGSAAETVSRLLDMGIEPYILRSGLLAVLNQRLLRQLCDCARDSSDTEDRLGLSVQRVRRAVGCEACRGTGYKGRFLIVELVVLIRTDLGRAVLSRADTTELEKFALQAGMVSRWTRACRAVDAGQTSPAEVRRVLGFGD
ncbi:MAG: GspE/PulE family protein [Thermoguttaceae bacterium]|jgi:type II secretory ATPase GspE/PulE/Tfp pilus assembly ATPase PilB-like protein